MYIPGKCLEGLLGIVWLNSRLCTTDILSKKVLSIIKDLIELVIHSTYQDVNVWCLFMLQGGIASQFLSEYQFVRIEKQGLFLDFFLFLLTVEFTWKWRRCEISLLWQIQIWLCTPTGYCWMQHTTERSDALPMWTNIAWHSTFYIPQDGVWVFYFQLHIKIQFLNSCS